MSEREKQTEFLRELMRSHASQHCSDLQLRMAKAERDERCVRSAVRLAFLLGSLSALGLGYSAVFLPELFRSNTSVTVQVFTALLLASGICLAGFIALWCWYRWVSNGVCHEGRRFIISRQEP